MGCVRTKLIRDIKIAFDEAENCNTYNQIRILIEIRKPLSLISNPKPGASEGVIVPSFGTGVPGNLFLLMEPQLVLSRDLVGIQS